MEEETGGRRSKGQGFRVGSLRGRVTKVQSKELRKVPVLWKGKHVPDKELGTRL